MNDRFDYQRQVNEEMEQMTVMALKEAQDKGVSEWALLTLASMSGARWKPDATPAR